jgi:hypothetical protein
MKVLTCGPPGHVTIAWLPAKTDVGEFGVRQRRTCVLRTDHVCDADAVFAGERLDVAGNGSETSVFISTELSGED